MTCHCENDVWYCEILRLNGGNLLGFSVCENLRTVSEAELFRDFVQIGELSHYLQEIMRKEYSMKCRVCDCEIPGGRLKALPGTTTCVEHSDAVPITEDTFGVLDTADSNDLYASMLSATSSDRWY